MGKKVKAQNRAGVINLQDLKQEGYYLLVEEDKKQRIKGFSLSKKLSEAERQFFSLNKAGFRYLKKHFGFEVVKQKVEFHYTPFAELHKTGQPLMNGFSL